MQAHDASAPPAARRPLRILGVANASISHTHKWATYFARGGHSVRLLPFEPVHREVAHLPASVTVEQWSLPPLHLRRLHVPLRALSRLRRLIRTWQPDLVQVHFLGHGAWYSALAGGAPLALWVMGGDITGTRWKPGSRREEVLSAYALRRARIVTAWSRNLLRIVQPMTRTDAKCAVVVGGVDRDVFRRVPEAQAVRAELGLPGDAFVVLSCRLCWPLYNTKLVVEAFARVREADAGARLVLLTYGSEHRPDYFAEVLATMRRLSLESYVRLVPEVAYSNMPMLMSAADCVVSVPDADGTPMTVMEAAACGTPCVVHDLPDYDDEVLIHERTVLRVPLRDPVGLAAAILRLRDPGLRSQLAANGQSMVERFADYRTEMGRLEALYDEVATSR